MALWLDMLRTPMAAPETARLRTMRLSWLALCVTLAGAVTLLDQLRGRIGRAAPCLIAVLLATRSEEHTSELQSLMRISYAVFCLQKKKNTERAQNIKENMNRTNTK